MDDVIEKLKMAFGTSFAFYMKAHNFHWNVEGPQFYMFHDFFGDIYEEVQSSLDATAEQIRTLDAYTPGTLNRLQDLSTVNGEERVGLPPLEMVKILLEDNEKVRTALLNTFAAAEKENLQGLMDHLATRIDSHNKHRWMLQSHLKKVG
jgi:starvation-inducible DNA-binding protein